MRETKTEQWRRLCSENPGMSPFVLLKISMVWHGARLSAAALARLQEGDYRFASAEPFDILDYQLHPNTSHIHPHMCG